MNRKIEMIVVSDNHGLKYPLEYVKKVHPEANYFIHCGDSEFMYQELSGFHAVRGNNDFDSAYPEHLILEIDQYRFYIAHGHKDLYMYQLNHLVQKAKKLACNVVLFGHTHIYTEQFMDGILLLNPGSMRYNRDSSAPSYMKIVISNHKITCERCSINE